MYFSKRMIRKLMRDKQYLRSRRFGIDNYFTSLSFYFDPEANVSTYIDFLKALPHFIKRLTFPEMLAQLSSEEVRSVLKYLPKTVHEIDFSYFPFDSTSLDLSELPPWIEKLFLGGQTRVTYDEFFLRNPSLYAENLVACIASIPSTVRHLSLQGQSLRKWQSEELRELGPAIPETIESLDLSDTALSMCRLSDCVPLLAELKVSELDLSWYADPTAGLNLESRKTAQEAGAILSALSNKIRTLHCSNTLFSRNMSPESVQIVLEAVPPCIHTLTVDIPRYLIRISLLPTVRRVQEEIRKKFIDIVQMPSQICHQRLGLREFGMLVFDGRLQEVVIPGTVRILTLLMNTIHCNSPEYRLIPQMHQSWIRNELAAKLPQSCRELRLPCFGFSNLSISACASFFEALSPNIKVLDLSFNTDLVKYPGKLLSLVHGMPDTVCTVRLDNIDLGLHLNTQQLIELFHEMPKHLHLSLNNNSLFTARSRRECQEIFSAIRLGRPHTVDTFMDNNGGESDTMRALPILGRVAEKNDLPLEMVAQILSFLGPEKTKRNWDEPVESKGCCTIL